MLMMESAQFPDVQCYLLSYTNTRIEQPLESLSLLHENIYAIKTYKTFVEFQQREIKVSKIFIKLLISQFS